VGERRGEMMWCGRGHVGEGRGGEGRGEEGEEGSGDLIRAGRVGRVGEIW
jgi:hypothetical protein